MNIEIVTCCNAKLKETGFGSELACNDVLAAVKLMGHSVLVTVCQSLHDLKKIVKRNPDFVILAAKYLPVEGGEDIWFSDFFEQNDLIFSGSGRETLKFDSDKVLAKVHLENLGINTARHFTATPGQYKIEDQLPFDFPFFVKPTDAANGNGIDDKSFVENFAEYEAKVLALYLIYGQPVLIEEYLSGREFTVGILKSGSGKMVISAMELVPPLSSGSLRILGATVKTLDTEVIKKIDINNIESVKQVAAAAFLGLGVRGFGRIDVKMDQHSQCYFMEANLVPGMNYGTSYFPKACEIANEIPFNEVIQLMLEECFERVVARQAFNKTFKYDVESSSCAV